MIVTTHPTRALRHCHAQAGTGYITACTASVLTTRRMNWTATSTTGRPCPSRLAAEHFICLFLGCLTSNWQHEKCISGTDLLGQFYVLPHRLSVCPSFACLSVCLLSLHVDLVLHKNLSVLLPSYNPACSGVTGY